MPPTKLNFAEELVRALQDDNVIAAFSNIFEVKLKAVMTEITALKSEVTQVKSENTELRRQLGSVQIRIEELEAYNRRDNLIISGLPLQSYTEAASTATPNENNAHIVENSTDTEKAALQLFTDCLHLPISSSDISVAHRLRTKPQSTAGTVQQQGKDSPAVIVKFTNRKARDAVFRARLLLKDINEDNRTKIYINEDLTKHVAELFRQARSMVRSKRAHSAWTSGGALFIKKTAASSKMKVSSKTELETL